MNETFSQFILLQFDFNQIYCRTCVCRMYYMTVERFKTWQKNCFVLQTLFGPPASPVTVVHDLHLLCTLHARTVITVLICRGYFILCNSVNNNLPGRYRSLGSTVHASHDHMSSIYWYPQLTGRLHCSPSAYWENTSFNILFKIIHANSKASLRLFVIQVHDPREKYGEIMKVCESAFFSDMNQV